MKTDYFGQIILVLIGALASGFAGYWFGNQPENISNIEYLESSNGSLLNRIGGADKFKITYNKKNLKKLSNTSYTLANTSKSNFDKVKIYFDIENKDLLPIFHVVNTPNDFPKEAITLISDKNGVYVFELEYLNRSEHLFGGINITFYFAGDKPSNITLRTGTKAISLQKYNFTSPAIMDSVISGIAKIWWLIGLYLVVGYLVYRYNVTDKALTSRNFINNLRGFFEKEGGDNLEQKIDEIIEYRNDEPSFSNVFRNIFRDFDAPKKSKES